MTRPAILSQPKRYFLNVFLPSFLAWVCKLAVIGIFLVAFAIPVTFEAIMWVRRIRVTRQRRLLHPGAVGITQATNALALKTCCDVTRETAVAYSAGPATDRRQPQRATPRAAHPPARPAWSLRTPADAHQECGSPHHSETLHSPTLLRRHHQTSLQQASSPRNQRRRPNPSLSSHPSTSGAGGACHREQTIGVQSI
jgi:hypothetical protein